MKEHQNSEGPSQSTAKAAQKEDESAKQKGKTNKKLEKFLEVKGIKKNEVGFEFNQSRFLNFGGDFHRLILFPYIHLPFFFTGIQ